MSCLRRRVLKARLDVIGLEVGIVREDFRFAGSGSQESQNVRNPNTHSAHGRTPVHDVRANRDPLQQRHAASLEPLASAQSDCAQAADELWLPSGRVILAVALPLAVPQVINRSDNTRREPRSGSE